MHISEFQRLIARKYEERDRQRGIPATFMWFIEEVGELATALQGGAGTAGQAEDQAAHDHLEEEFADVLAWLCTLANINQVDLAQAVREKYLTGSGPAGHK